MDSYKKMTAEKMQTSSISSEEIIVKKIDQRHFKKYLSGAMDLFISRFKPDKTTSDRLFVYGRGIRRNIPNFNEYQRRIKKGQLKAYIATVGPVETEKLVGIIIYLEIRKADSSATSSSIIADTYSHQKEFINKQIDLLQDNPSWHMVFIDLVIIHKNYQECNVFKALWNRIRETTITPQTYFFSLVSPFNFMLIKEYQESGFLLLLNQDKKNHILFSHTFRQHWIFKDRTISWVPVIYEPSSNILNTISSDSSNTVDIKLSIKHKYHNYACCLLQVPPNGNYNLKCRICGCLLSTAKYTELSLNLGFTHAVSLQELDLIQISDRVRICEVFVKLLFSNQIDAAKREILSVIRYSMFSKRDHLRTHIVTIGDENTQWDKSLQKEELIADIHHISSEEIDIDHFSLDALPKKVDHIIISPCFFLWLYDYTKQRYCTVDEKVGFYNRLLTCLTEKQATLHLFEITGALAADGNWDKEIVSPLIAQIQHKYAQNPSSVKYSHISKLGRASLFWYFLAELRIAPVLWETITDHKMFKIRKAGKSRPVNANSLSFDYLRASIIPLPHKFIVRMAFDGLVQTNSKNITISGKTFQSDGDQMTQRDYERLLYHYNYQELPMCAAEIFNQRHEAHQLGNLSNTILFIMVTGQNTRTSHLQIHDNLIKTTFPDYGAVFFGHTIINGSCSNDTAINSYGNIVHDSKTKLMEGDPIFTAFVWFQRVHKDVFFTIANNDANYCLVSLLIYRYSAALQGFVEHHEHRILEEENIELETIRNLVSHLNDYAISRMEKTFRERTDKAAVAAIMSRNMSHNIGSHSLSNPKFWNSLGSENEKEKRLQTFNYYCQGRLDLIARVISGLRDKAEILLLIKEVLFGFMEQKVLLDTLLDDCGVTTKNFKMVIHSITGQIVYYYNQSTLVADNKGIVDDIWVEVVGGTTGCHALYAVFENILRNAAKYSRDEIKPLELHIRIQSTIETEKRNRYGFTIWDNWTKEVSFQEIKHYLNQPLETLASSGHGFREIRCCADYLHAIENRQLLVATGERTTEDPTNKVLYQMEMPKPLFMVICTNENKCFQVPSFEAAKQREKRLSDARSKGIYLCNDIKSIAAQSPLLGVIELPNNEDDIRGIISDIAKDHTTLPFRLLLITHEKNVYNLCNNLIGATSANRSNNHFYPNDRDSLNSAIDDFRKGGTPTILPRNRIQIALTPSGKSLFAVDHVNWEEILLLLWTEWLKKWKTAFSEWNIVIGLGKSGDPSKWHAGLSSFKNVRETKSVVDILNVFIRSETDEGVRLDCLNKGDFKTYYQKLDGLEKIDGEMPPQSNNLIVFDRHGNSYTGIKPDDVGMYHPFSGQQSVLYAFLSNPPQDPISLAVLLLSVLESGLLIIGVVDERVSESLLIEQDNIFRINFHPPLSAIRGYFGLLTRANIIPFYSIQIDTSGSLLITSKASSWIRSAEVIRDAFELEGVRIDKNTKDISIRRFSGENTLSSIEIEPDVLIIHEGIVDQYKSNQWMSSYFSLYTMMSAIIRTSGRGNEPRAFEADVPFLEFNVVSDSCFGSLDKIKLSRAIMSIT